MKSEVDKIIRKLMAHNWVTCPSTGRPRCDTCWVFGDFPGKPDACVSSVNTSTYDKDGEPSKRPSRPTSGQQVESGRHGGNAVSTQLSDAVRAFLEAGGWSQVDPDDLDPQHAVIAAHIAGNLQHTLNMLHETPVLALSRLHCLLEEVQELSHAMSQRDRVGIADALADITYIVFGTAVLYAIPLEECFLEVHRSNMTKDFGDFRRPKKGENYQPPQLDDII